MFQPTTECVVATVTKIWDSIHRKMKLLYTVYTAKGLDRHRVRQNIEYLLKGKGRYSSSWEPHLRATGRHLLYGITQCYLPPDTSVRAPPNPSHAGRYSIYLPRSDGRLS